MKLLNKRETERERESQNEREKEREKGVRVIERVENVNERIE